MKYAMVNGQRQEAHPDLKDKGGKCPGCGRPVIARTGEKNIWHWAHKGRRDCDPWWENETEWHRAWKGKFPADWQEFRQEDENGEWHIADVKTHEGWVIEFQHSNLNPDERRARDTFYQPKLIWVVDGLRLKKDKPQFLNALEEGTKVGGDKIVRIAFWDECRLLREWADGNRYIFFDFDEDVLWWLYKSQNGQMYVAQYPRTEFIKRHHNGDFEEIFRKFKEAFAKYEYVQAQKMKLIHQQPRQVRPDLLMRLLPSYTLRGKRLYARRSRRL